MSVRIPRNLLIGDRVALGLTRGQLLAIAAPAALGYGCWHSLGGGLGLGAGLAIASLGLVLALVPFEGSPLVAWIALGSRWLPRHRPVLLEVHPC